jgi:hypothetical protein
MHSPHTAEVPPVQASVAEDFAENASRREGVDAGTLDGGRLAVQVGQTRKPEMRGVGLGGSGAPGVGKVGLRRSTALLLERFRGVARAHRGMQGARPWAPGLWKRL